jgi:excisionase family DNA binding protein
MAMPDDDRPASAAAGDGTGPGSPALVGLADAAALLGVHYMTAYRYVRTGRLAAERRDGRWRVELADLEALVAGPPRDGHDPEATRRSGPRRQIRLASRLVAGDEAGAWAILEDAQVSGVEPTAVYVDLLAPALAEVGDRWEAGVLGVGDEHRATAVALRLIGRLGPRFARRGRRRGTVVVGAPAGERHGIPVAMVADLLRSARYEVVDLGPDAPADAFAGAVGRERSAGRHVVVLVGVTVADHLGAARSAAAASRAAGATVLVGGAAVPDAEHAAELGADGFTGRTATDAVAAVDARFGTRAVRP